MFSVLVPMVAGPRAGCELALVPDWSVCFVLLGYSLGASWRLAEGWIGRTTTVVLGAAIVAAVLTWLWRRRARRGTR